MFTHHSQIVRALERVGDYSAPKSTSLMVLSGGSDPHADPFRSGFLSTMDERHEVIRRLRLLDSRAQQLLLLWHVANHPVTEIAKQLKMSRVHCYRVRKQALEAMLAFDATNETDERAAEGAA